MANGTINLVNNSTALTGAGSKFLTEVTPGDFIYVEVGTVPYTLPVDKVNSDTSITLLRKFTGPTINGIAWTLIPRRAQNSVASALADQVAEAIRLSLNNENNWQKLLTENGNVTITRPDGSSYTGPSWVYLLNTVLKKGDYGLGGHGTNAMLAAADAKKPQYNGFYGVQSEPTYGNAAMISFGFDSGSQTHIIAKQGGQAPSLGICGSTPQGAFGVWGKIYTEFQKPTYADVSAVPYRGPLNDVDLNNVRGAQYGRFCQPLTANATAARHYPLTEAGALDVHQTSANGAEACVQEYRSFSSRRTFTRTFNPSGSIWTAWAEFFTTANSTRASDGTLKAASPIVKLFADGSFETNEESEGATVTRLDVGQYLIEGCEALNSDAAWGGWDGGFDIPTDRNKQPLIWLDYDVNQDGSVLVKTYHRTHPDSPEFARNRIGYKNDAGDFIETVANWDPVDIPSDQFVSVRVEMPQDSIWNQRQKEIAEMMDSETSNQESTTGDEVEKG